MNKEVINLIIEIVITIGAFLLGRYVVPKVKANIKNPDTQFQVLLSYAESFCAYARQFLNCSGSEKMDNVVEKLKAICIKYNIEVDDETLRAIGQKAYDAMKAGENSSKVIIESAVQELRTIPTYGSKEEGVTLTTTLDEMLEEATVITDPIDR